MSEKTDIERATAEAFIQLHNSEMGTSYRIIEYSDAPDVYCIDSEGNELRLEITMTEDRLGDIRAQLGRSDHRTLKALRVHLEKVKAGEASALERSSSLFGNVSWMAARRIQSKLSKDYGPRTALVVRDTSGVDWDWDLAVEDIKANLDLTGNPFDMGIWVLSLDKSKIFRLA